MCGNKMGSGYYAAGFTVAFIGIFKAVFYMVIFVLAFKTEVRKDWFLIALLGIEEGICFVYIVCNIYLMVGITKV